MGLTLLAKASMDLKYWWQAFSTATYLLNRLPTPVLNHKSPYEQIFHQPLVITFFAPLVVLVIHTSVHTVAISSIFGPHYAFFLAIALITKVTNASIPPDVFTLPNLFPFMRHNFPIHYFFPFLHFPKLSISFTYFHNPFHHKHHWSPHLTLPPILFSPLSLPLHLPCFTPALLSHLFRFHLSPFPHHPLSLFPLLFIALVIPCKRGLSPALSNLEFTSLLLPLLLLSQPLSRLLFLTPVGNLPRTRNFQPFSTITHGSLFLLLQISLLSTASGFFVSSVMMMAP